MRVLLIIRSDTQIRRYILKSRKMDCLNERCADSIRKLREIFFSFFFFLKCASKGGKGRGQTMNRWHLRKADLCWPVRKSAVSQWSRVKRGMKAWEWASAGVRVPCIPWAANLPVSPLSPRPASLFWKAAALAAECLLQHIGRQSGCETCQMKVHSVQTHTKLSMCLSFWHSAPYMNSAGLNLEAQKPPRKTPTTAYLFGKHSSLWISLIYHITFTVLLATACLPLLFCSVSKLIRLRWFYFSRARTVSRSSASPFETWLVNSQWV